MCKECKTFQQIAEEASQREKQAFTDLENAERELRVKRAAVTRLQNQIDREHELSEEATVVKEIIEYYAKTTGHTRTKITPIGANADAIRKAFRMKHTVEEIKQAIDGAAKFPFVTGPGQRSATGKKQQRYDSLETILRNENQIRKFRELAGVDLGEPVALETEDVSLTTAERMRALNYPLARVLSALWQIDAPLENPNADEYRTMCPVHFGPGLIARRSDEGLMSLLCSSGCEWWRLLAALKLEPADLFENAEHDPDRLSARNGRSVPSHLVEAAGLLQVRLSGLA